MSFSMLGRRISKIAVIGSGQIGPDIALYFAKVLTPHDVPVIVTDIAPAALEAGAARARKKIDKGVETGAFKPADADAMRRHLRFTSDPRDVEGADLVVEAATERADVKQGLFEKLESQAAPDAVLASNSSHLEPETIFERVRRKDRALVIHYFFPAERNPLVEIVPGRDTSPGLASFCMAFYEAIGKVPIQVKSRYGYAIDPIFEGLFLAALLLADEGLATPKQIDAVAQKTLSLGVGPFTAMNLTGGNPITQVGLTHYHDKIMPWFRSPKSLDDLAARKGSWPAAAKGESVDVDETTAEAISRRLLGAYFGLAAEILQSGIVSAGDLELGVELGLVMTPPLRLMNETGVARSLQLVQSYAREHPGFRVAPILQEQASRGTWKIPAVFRRDEGDPLDSARGRVAVVTIKRPRVLNALNLELYRQLRETFDDIARDPRIAAAVLTGFGDKAFVSGADISMLASIRSAADGEAASRLSLGTLDRIENLGKPVVCALNGLSLGGGSELAYACTARIARRGIPTLFGQPEVKLGIIPGAGGSIRLPRLIDFATAWKLLRAGGTLTGAEALRLGLIREEVADDLIGRAIDLARQIASGQTKVEPIRRDPVEIPAELPEVDLGHLSRKVDEILRSAILEGARLPLEHALRLESAKFGEVCGTEDMRIGLENFLKTNLKEPAQFVHR
ncbi:MAG: enoyl-CoA hydratase/isomerase family protein [Planctomycetes bacterium]|nr:enoyl-CoA hydratase/isomerase family protein [Planctomycetota bacterium]